jgi:hypothetical protein
VNLKLLRLLPHITDKFIFAYVDVEFLDLQIRLKGIRFTIKGNLTMVHLPYLFTEKGFKYTPFQFLSDEAYHIFKRSFIDLIQREYPLIKWQMGKYDIDLPKIPT